MKSKTMLYVRDHWQLYVIFLLPALALTIIFRYIPMGLLWGFPVPIILALLLNRVQSPSLGALQQL